MERRYEIRKREILQDTEIKPHVTDGMLKRLEQFAEPFAADARHLPSQFRHSAIAPESP